GGRPPDACDRPLLLQIGLLPRAERGALRDRDDRPRVRGGRGREASRRAALAPAAVRAAARAVGAHAGAAALPAAVAGGSLRLVPCLVNGFTAGDLFDDVVGWGGADEGLWGLVV